MTIYLITFLLGIIIYYWKSRTSKPKNFPPGPPRYPLVGSASFITPPNSNKPNVFWGIRELANKYGDIYGLYLGSMRSVVFTKYEDVKEIFNMDETSGRPSSAPGHKFRPGWETVAKVEPEMNKNRPPGVLLSNGRFWREQRRYLLRNLRDFGFGKSSMEESLLEEVQKLVEFMKPEAGKEFNLNRITNVAILNALWFIMAGERLEIDDPKALEILSLLDDLTRQADGPANTLANMLPDPNMALWPGLKQFTGLDYAEKTFNKITNFIMPYVEEHKKTFDDNFHRDFMDLMLSEIQKTTDPSSSFYGKTGEYAMINDFIDLFLAGAETTSSSLLWSILYLLHFPDIQSRIHAEIDEVIGSERLPSLDDKVNMDYINAFILESFRYTSFVPFVFHHSLEDIEYKGYHLPKDSALIYSLMHIMHDPTYFKNPEIFQPERFLDSEGKFVNDERVVPFGIGKRFCLGRSLAEKEFFLFFVGLLQVFKFDNIPGIKPPPYEFDTVPVSGILRTVPPYKCILRLRD